jgi:murein DD-endopeptidase MepM/ murein hydrolase activator NlpD
MKFTMCYPLMFPFVLSQPWGLNAEYYNKIGFKGHNGWDFSTVTGTPVYATHDGKVDFAGIDGTDSKTIALDTLQEYDYEGKKVKFRTMYAHLSEYFVSPGQMVKKGDKIGLTGNTGRYTTGPHLHFGVKPIVNYSPIDVNNGYNGCVDPIHFFDGTYPSRAATKPQHVTAFIQALNDFQRAEGIVPAPRIGPKTTTSLKRLGIM